MTAGAVTAMELRPVVTDNKIVYFRSYPAVDADAQAFLQSLLEPAAPWGAVPGGVRWDRP